MTKFRNTAFNEILEEFSLKKDSGKSNKNENREKGDVTLSKQESVDTSLKLVLVDLKQERETEAGRHLRDAGCSGSKSQMTGREEEKNNINY